MQNSKLCSRLKPLLFAYFFIALPISAAASTHLILIGGGNRPRIALKRFIEHSQIKKNQGTIWVLPWGTQYPVESFEAIHLELKTLGAKNVQCSCNPNLSIDEQISLSLKLKESAGVFFPGGDQNLLFNHLVKNKIAEVIQELYRSGVAVGGTSAGTAIQSNPMLSGNGSELTTGLGLLVGILVDQHFIVRNRESRLVDALLGLPETIGLGIDENMAAEIKDDSTITALGPSSLMIFLKNSRMILNDGDAYHLKTNSLVRGQTI